MDDIQLTVEASVSKHKPQFWGVTYESLPTLLGLL